MQYLSNSCFCLGSVNISSQTIFCVLGGEIFMKNRIKSIRNRIKDESGVVPIVEATIVFPVMFFILFFIIFIGNMYFEQSKVDDIVMRYAIKGAQCVKDPFEYNIDKGSGVPTDTKNLKITPYRYILGGLSGSSISNIEDNISNDVKKAIQSDSLIFFSNSKANYVGTDNDKIATFNNYVVYSTFVVQVNYEVKFPIRFLGDDYPVVAHLSSRAEVSVDDCAEFIRNVDMVADLFEGTKAGDAIKSTFNKINSFIQQFSK